MNKFAREYLEGRDLEQNPFIAIDFENIAEGQLELIKKAEESIDNANETVPRLIFCDTDALITELVIEIRFDFGKLTSFYFVLVE